MDEVKGFIKFHNVLDPLSIETEDLSFNRSPWSSKHMAYSYFLSTQCLLAMKRARNNAWRRDHVEGAPPLPAMFSQFPMLNHMLFLFLTIIRNDQPQPHSAAFEVILRVPWRI